MYYMDDTNSSIVYNGLPSKWSKLSPTSDAWVNNTEIYNSTLTHSACETTDNCSALIPFTGSGITIYCVIRSSLTIGITVDGTSSTYNFADDNSCLNSQQLGCFNQTVYDAQILPYGDHNVTISMYSVPQSARDLSYSDFYLDYVAINDTVPSSSPSSVSPSPSISPVPGVSTSRPAPTTSVGSPRSKSGALPSGGTVGVVFGTVVGIIVLLWGAVMWLRRRKRKVNQTSRPSPTAHYPTPQMAEANQNGEHIPLNRRSTSNSISGHNNGNDDSLPDTSC
jgi:hypothetical protein